MDEVCFAPPKKPWNGDSPVNTNQQQFRMVSKWCRISSIHGMSPMRAFIDVFFLLFFCQGADGLIRCNRLMREDEAGSCPPYGSDVHSAAFGRCRKGPELSSGELASNTRRFGPAVSWNFPSGTCPRWPAFGKAKGLGILIWPRFASRSI